MIIVYDFSFRELRYKQTYYIAISPYRQIVIDAFVHLGKYLNIILYFPNNYLYVHTYVRIINYRTLDYFSNVRMIFTTYLQ